MAASPFFGRGRELAALNDAFTRAAGGQGGIVAVVGESGIGKTRTVREFLAGIEAVKLWGQCYEGEWQAQFDSCRPYPRQVALARCSGKADATGR